MPLLQRLYGLLISAATGLQSPFLLIVRVAWGYQMHKAGAVKLHDIGKVVASFSRLGIPFPDATAIFIAVLEFVGGLLFALGVGSRLIALLFVCDMAVALATVDHAAVRAVFSNPKLLYAAPPYTYLVAALIVLCFGPGKISLDALLAKRFARSASSPRASSRA